MDVKQVIKRAGGVLALANALSIDHSAVSKWQRRGRVPVERVPDVERITGIPRHVLRPDLWEPPLHVATMEPAA